MGKKRAGKNELPRGWDEARIRRVLAHYENQTDEAAAREDEEAFAHPDQTVMKVPKALVPAVRQLIALSERD